MLETLVLLGVGGAEAGELLGEGRPVRVLHHPAAQLHQLRVADVVQFVQLKTQRYSHRRLYTKKIKHIKNIKHLIKIQR